MKTQLIPLESHDDLISVRDRMSWAETPRILLVWPKERVALRPLDLKILQRHAAALGAQLGLVVRHRGICREAQALDIPVFNSTGDAQRSPWPERNLQRKQERQGPRLNLQKMRKQAQAKEGAWRSHPVMRIGAFVLGVLAVLAMAALFIPQAQVIITPEKDLQTVTLPVQADPSLEAVFITGNIPSQTVSVIVEGSQDALGTGKVPVPQVKARGMVTFRNLTEEAVSIPVGTVLTSTSLPGVRFLTVEPGELASGLKATVDVPIEAESVGASGNVEAGTILAIEGNLGLLVTVTNAELATGGSDRMMDAATEADLARLREELLAKLESQALKEMEATLKTGDQIFFDTLKMKRILDENYDPPLGQPGREVKLSMQVEFTASYASGEDLTELASTVLNASLPEGFMATQAPVEFEPLTPHLTDKDGITRWSVRVSRQMEKQLDTGKIIPLVQGRSMVLATAHLKDNLDLTDAPEIRLTPDWWPWLPLIPFNITVETR
ncbi:MAG: baseplate J/gp47 family protein [Anaerolineales bacterium]|nr:baseplate J/gp47 family protein [Anaerolineales bacterium]